MIKKEKSTVETPAFVIKKMIDYMDTRWQKVHGKIESNYRKYVFDSRLELACGEAPFITTRTDPYTAAEIPFNDRTGILDRKFNIINQYAKTDEEWLWLATAAVSHVFGCELAGDSIFLARLNILATAKEAFENRFNRPPGDNLLAQWAFTLSLNIRQIDLLTGLPPFKTENTHADLFDDKELCQSVYDTLDQFDAVVGNPPYQAAAPSEKQKTFFPSVYHIIMEKAYQHGKYCLFIHPARCLFDQGLALIFNKKILNDPHVRVLYFERNSRKIFPNTQIAAGVAITERDAGMRYEPIKLFIPYPEKRSILDKVEKHGYESFSNIVAFRKKYVYSNGDRLESNTFCRYTKKMFEEHPEATAAKQTKIQTSGFTKLPYLFFDEKPNDGKEYIQILGRQNNQRCLKWIRKDYIKIPEDFTKWRVFVPRSSGPGLSAVPSIGKPVIGKPMVGYTDTFIGVGSFDTEEEANACMKYIQTKFARALLGIVKTTQSTAKKTWRYVPLQDFTENSDIDWHQSIPEIDKQLYAKYELNEIEINFIESNITAKD